MPIKYPRGELDSNTALLGSLGTFWVDLFKDSDKLKTYFTGMANQYEQTYLNLLETISCLSRKNIKVFHKELWSFITFKQSDLNTQDSGKVQYGQDKTYGDGTLYNQSLVDLFSLPIPASKHLKQAGAIFNRITIPSVTLLPGIDFTIVGNSIVFNANPFNNVLIPKRPIYGLDNKVVDHEIGLWVYAGEYDTNLVYNYFGYVLDLNLPSSENNKKLLNAIFDSHIAGSSMLTLTSLISAALGVPTAIEVEETVESIHASSKSLQVITDKNVYTFNPLANAIVSVGDVVQLGDQLVDTLKFIDFKNDADLNLLPGITAGPGIIESKYFGELFFRNDTVAVEYVGKDDSGKAIVKFEVSGFPGDVALFWDNVHAAGVESGKTLANYLDTRAAPVGEPESNNVQKTINPMKFILSNILQNNLVAIKFKYTSAGTVASGFEYLSLIKEIIPPHTSCIVFLDVVVDMDTYDTESGVDDTTGVLCYFITPEDVVDYNVINGNITYVDLNPLVYVETGECANSFGESV